MGIQFNDNFSLCDRNGILTVTYLPRKTFLDANDNKYRVKYRLG